jgi:hypothetical protein
MPPPLVQRDCCALFLRPLQRGQSDGGAVAGNFVFSDARDLGLDIDAVSHYLIGVTIAKQRERSAKMSSLRAARVCTDAFLTAPLRPWNRFGSQVCDVEWQWL